MPSPTHARPEPEPRCQPRRRDLPRRRRVVVALAVLGLLAGACAEGSDEAGSSGNGEPGFRPAPVASPDGMELTGEQSLTDDGVELAGDLGGSPPRYHVTAEIDPTTGHLTGTIDAALPVGDVDTVNLRYFAGAVDESASVSDVTVDGQPADFEVQHSLLMVGLDQGHEDRVELHATFDYEVPETPAADPLGDLGSAYGEDALQPAEIGLLGRTDDVVALGHWFPVWLPEGVNAEPAPDGFGDIGNFPAAVVSAEVDVPDGWTLVTGGERQGEDGSTVAEVGVGVRDLAMTLLQDPETAEVEVGDTTVRVLTTGDDTTLQEVLAEAEASVQALSDTLGPYPWTELEVVATPLGSGVGGMEWPGMVWIEPSIFQGSLPGLGDLGIGDLEDLEDLGLGDLGETLGLDFEALGQTRAWTVAHEVGHQWWHAVVGNDSITDPAVDEPLAQYSACIVFRQAWPDQADSVCTANMAGGYQQMRMLGVEDATAAQASDEFDSSLQYGGVVYGKAPGVYDALAAEFGDEATVEALAGVVDEHAFEQISVDQLHGTLADQLGDAGTVEEIWTRWMHETHGDEDLHVEAGGLGDLGDLGDLGGIDIEELIEILEQLGG